MFRNRPCFLSIKSVRGAIVRGILPEMEDKVADFRSHIKAGSLDSLTPEAFNIVLGSELARALGVFIVGDEVTLIARRGGYACRCGSTAENLPDRTSSEVRMFEYDCSGLALIRMEDAQRLYRLEDRVSGVRLKLDDLFKAPQVVRQLANR